MVAARATEPALAPVPVGLRTTKDSIAGGRLSVDSWVLKTCLAGSREGHMYDDATTVTDVRSASQGGHACDEVWQPPETLQAFVAAGCRTLIPELIATFKDDTDSRLHAMDDAIASGNLP